jgi:hypothetical protein
MKPLQLTWTKPSPVTLAVSWPSFNTSIVEWALSSVTTQPLLQLEYAKLPVMTSGAPFVTAVLENKTMHSTLIALDNSVALPTETSWTELTRLAVEHRLSSALHSAVFSAIADEAPTKAIAISAISAARPNSLIDFT